MERVGALRGEVLRDELATEPNALGVTCKGQSERGEETTLVGGLLGASRSLPSARLYRRTSSASKRHGMRCGAFRRKKRDINSTYSGSYHPRRAVNVNIRAPDGMGAVEVGCGWA